MIIDCITFRNEAELFEIRYNILKDFVDEFRVIEFDQTFSGKPKIALFAQNWPKVKSFYIKEDIWSKYEDLAIKSPNTEYGKGAKHWIREFCQKESIKDCLTDLQDNDIIFIGDCDEIWNPKDFEDWKEDFKKENWNIPQKLKLRVYSYFLNLRSNEDFNGTIFCNYKVIKDNCLNHLRNQDSYKCPPYGGWHFTSVGGYEKVKEKLTDSYTAESYATSQVLGNLEKNIKDNKDFLGRDFKYELNEESWPDYLKENKDKYKHLIKEL